MLPGLRCALRRLARACAAAAPYLWAGKPRTGASIYLGRASVTLARLAFARSLRLPLPVLDRLGDGRCLDALRAGEVGDGARDLQQAMAGARTKRHAPGGGVQERAQPRPVQSTGVLRRSALQVRRVPATNMRGSDLNMTLVS